MGKILLIDVDGTLVNYENQLPASAVNAIRKARANGHKVYICTGRSKAEVYPNLWEIGLDGMIGGNGSYVEDHGKVVMHQLITKEQCTHVVDWLRADWNSIWRATTACLPVRILRRPASLSFNCIRPARGRPEQSSCACGTSFRT